MIASPKLPEPWAVVTSTSSSLPSLFISMRKVSVSLFSSNVIGVLVAKPFGVITIVLRLAPSGLVSLIVSVLLEVVVNTFVVAVSCVEEAVCGVDVAIDRSG